MKLIKLSSNLHILQINELKIYFSSEEMIAVFDIKHNKAILLKEKTHKNKVHLNQIQNWLSNALFIFADEVSLKNIINILLREEFCN